MSETLLYVLAAAVVGIALAGVAGLILAVRMLSAMCRMWSNQAILRSEHLADLRKLEIQFQKAVVQSPEPQRPYQPIPSVPAAKPERDEVVFTDPRI